MIIIEYLRKKTWVIVHRFAELANLFSCQHFLLYDIFNRTFVSGGLKHLNTVIDKHTGEIRDDFGS